MMMIAAAGPGAAGQGKGSGRSDQAVRGQGGEED